MKAYYYYTHMTYHCYQVGPTDMLAGCHIRQAHWTTRGSLLRCQSVCVNCSRAPEGGQDEGYYYTPMTYHCYQMGPRDMLAGCSVKQSTLDDPQEQAYSRRPRGMAPRCARPDAPPITRCIPLQPHMALPFTSATASSWYACRRKVARSERFSEELTANTCSSTLHWGRRARTSPWRGAWSEPACNS